MKKMMFILAFLTLCGTSEAQHVPDGFVITPVGKSVGGFVLKIDRTTPLDIYLSTAYISTTGRRSLWREINTYRNRFVETSADTEVSEEMKQQILRNLVHEVIVCKDTVAAVIVQNEASRFPAYNILVQLCRLEDGHWVATGQDINTSVEAAREKFITQQAERHFEELAVIERLKQIPQDTAPFIEHLKGHGQKPADFLLNTLASHRIVVWGEVHRRRLSWNVLKDALHDPRFVETTGTVFMELPSHTQARMDGFFASQTMNPKIVYGIFSDEQPDGWFDRGEFEFIAELWKLNRSLPAEKRIRVVLVDYQIPYSEIKTAEELQNYPGQEDRNTHMADVVERTVRSSADRRGNLFIVGYGHAWKSTVPGGASTPRGMTPAPTAGAQLAARFPRDEVFSIFQHSPRMTNIGGKGGLLRDGVFDRAFAESGDKPIGFPLAGSPFGAEPFEADMSAMFDPRAGSFADNFDGYVFFGPLAEEEGDNYLYEIIDEDFVREIKRRIEVFGLDGWYGGLKDDELIPERMIDLLKSDSEGKKRWAGSFEN